MKIFKWIRDRAIEPSSWAAAGVACVAVAFLIDQFWVAVASLVLCSAAIIMRERGVI
jgi:hypothetical protein